ncbi:hypothetical protein FACS189434_01450 [Bacteroidia bacterium]|nr:hypothetical protein FACS189434_01450 [Bacteroidia bacterium]
MKKLYFLFAGLLSLNIQAQTSVNAGGGDAANGEVSLSYSIGQVFYEPFATVGGAIKAAPGVQQTYDIVEITPPNPPDGLGDISQGDIKLYPNPTTDYLVLSLSDSRNIKAALFDLAGHLLKTAEITSLQTQIDVQHLPAGAYLLTLYYNNVEIKIFKIVKQ